MSDKFTPFEHSLGPRPARLAIVGESWGQHEAMFRVPLVWWSGVELARMFSETGLGPSFSLPQDTAVEPYMMTHWLRSGHFYTNVFAEQPPDNKIESWCVKKKDLPEGYPAGFYRPGQYFLPEYLPHLERLRAELAEVQPNLILALGNAACWALLGTTQITNLRGTVAWSKFANCKVLPTFHPAYILRQWNMRTVVLQDLLKAKREVEFGEIRRPERWVTVDPSLQDILEWMRRPANAYSVDIETERGQISMIGFGRSRSDAIVIPFIKGEKDNYWPTHAEEVRAWWLIKELLEGPQVKIFQNGLFDLQYILRMGIRPRNCTEDTMLLAHSLWPEMRKGLGFLGSIFTNEASWKLMRTRKTETLKRED